MSDARRVIVHHKQTVTIPGVDPGWRIFMHRGGDVVIDDPNGTHALLPWEECVELTLLRKQYLKACGVVSPLAQKSQYGFPGDNIFEVLVAELAAKDAVVEAAKRVTRGGYCLPGWCGTDEGKECTCGMADLRAALRALDATNGGE